MSEEVVTSNINSNTITNKDSIDNINNGIINEGFTNDLLEEKTIDNKLDNNNSAISNGNNNNENNSINNNINDNNKKDNKNCDKKCNKPKRRQSRFMRALSPPPLEPPPPRDPDMKKHNRMKRHMSVAKGFMDISLFGANANQLRILISFGDRNDYTFYIIISSLVISLIVQLISGITLIVKEKFDLEDKWSHYLNNVIVIQVFFIVLINVFLSGFGINLMSKEELMVIEAKKNQTIFSMITSTIDPLVS